MMWFTDIFSCPKYLQNNFEKKKSSKLAHILETWHIEVPLKLTHSTDQNSAIYPKFA